jgi:hypothetical protein
MNNKDIEQYNEKNQKHGYSEVYFGDNLYFRYFYHNGKRVGYEEEYDCDGKTCKMRYNL